MSEPNEISRREAFKVLYDRIREGDALVDERFDTMLTTMDENKPHPRWIRRITHATNHAQIADCYELASNHLKNPNVASHFEDARWARLPSIFCSDRVLLTEHTSYSDRRVTIFDAIRLHYDLKTASLDNLIALLNEMRDFQDTAKMIDLLQEDPEQIVLRRVPSRSLRAAIYYKDEVVQPAAFIKNGMILYNPDGRPITLELPIQRSRKSRAAKRRPIEGLENVYVLPSDAA